MKNNFFKYILLSSGSKQNRTELETETLPYTFTSNSHKLRNYRIYGNTVNEDSVGNLVTEGEHTGEYCVTVTITNGTNIKTTNIYLSEKIRKVGDEFEYIDYREQKFHRVRKNMFNNNGASVYGYIDANGCLVESNYIKTYDFVECIAESNYTIKAFSTLDAGSNYAARVAFYDSNNNFISRFYSNAFPNGFVFHTPVNCAYFILSIDENIISNIMLVKGSTIPKTYEAYIENTEFDVTLPALPTLPGTNTLSVGTTVQPSKVYLQGEISEAEIVSAESVQTNVQSLQPLSLDNENAETDVMLIETGDDNSGFSDT